MAVVSSKDGGLPRCTEDWHGLRRTLYGAFTNLTQFVLPFVTIIMCYSAIIRKLKERRQQRPGMQRRSALKEDEERARTVRTNRMLISMVAVFGTCWLPLNTINFVADLNLFDVFCWSYYHLVFFVCHAMAMSSTCYNPFLYGWHNESFRKEFVKLVPILGTLCTVTRRGRKGDEAPNGQQRQQQDGLAFISGGVGFTTTNGLGEGDGGGDGDADADGDDEAAVSFVERQRRGGDLTPDLFTAPGREGQEDPDGPVRFNGLTSRVTIPQMDREKDGGGVTVNEGLREG